MNYGQQTLNAIEYYKKQNFGKEPRFLIVDNDTYNRIAGWAYHEYESVAGVYVSKGPGPIKICGLTIGVVRHIDKVDLFEVAG